MEALKPLILQVLSPECYDEFFVSFNFFHVECLKAAVSKGLGIGIIAGSLLVKVPQILKIFGARSAEGISFIGLMMELFAISANVAYSYRNGFPFSAWGEGFFLALQTAAIGALLLLYGTGSPAGKGKGGKAKNAKEGSLLAALSFLASYSAGLAAMLSPLAPLEFLWGCQAAIIPLIVISKMIQAVSNYKAGSTGQLSAITVSMLFLGAVARIFTSIQETGDSTVIATYVVSTLANGLILFQVLYYWNSGKKTKGQHQPKSQPKDQQRHIKKKKQN